MTRIQRIINTHTENPDLSFPEIADRFDTTIATVNYALDKHYDELRKNAERARNEPAARRAALESVYRLWKLPESDKAILHLESKATRDRTQQAYLVRARIEA